VKILAIETSCDETGIALVEGTKTSSGFVFKTEHAALLSQALLHSPYGGVFPNLAKREHLKNLPALFVEFEDIKDSIDAIVVTEGPGLEPALWTGIEFAKKLAADWQKPLFGVNHMEGHLVSSLAQNNALENIQFPVLGLLISGGHTEFVLMRDWFHYEIVGQTLDDAVGEAFDKVARMLNLPYPGGPHISKHAEEARAKNNVSAIKLPRPMMGTNTCDVSFSGLKTAALYALRDAGGIQNLSPEEVASFAREFEDTVAEVFVAKTRQALEKTGAQTFVIGGGVAANAFIRTQLEKLLKDEFPDAELRLPQLDITGDNAIMIAEAALVHLLAQHWKLSDEPKELRAQGQMSLESK
jgi:N6-L-threonylcarbamoyladenine synthase